MSERGRALLAAAGALILAAAASPAGAAPKILGPNKCASCHDHEKQKQWADKDTHAKALSQLEDKNAAKYAKAIGLADPYDLKGSCVSCHATVFNGDANAGVSCETCHGAGSDYVEPHQQKGSYAKAVTLGMFDTRGNLPIWAKMCVDCHVLRDPKLTAAGHKSGADFDVGASSQKIVHWAPSYDYAKLSAAGKAGGGRPAGSPAPPKPAPAPAPTSPPAAAPTPPLTKPAAAATRAPTAPAAAAPPPASVTAPAAKQAPTEVPRPAPPAPERRAPSPPPPTGAKPAPRAGEIAIEIQATPIPTVTPRRAAPGPAGRFAAQPPAQRGSPRPAPRLKTKPRHRRTPGLAAAPAPPPAQAPTRTPTRRPAPQLPPQRAPH